MRKHFLLLFLMALLPLAGWAESYEVKVRAMAFEISYGAATPTEVQDGMFMVTDWNGYPGGVDDKATVSAAIKAKLSFTSERAANSNVGNIQFTLSVADGDFVQYGDDYFFINIANANGTFKQIKAVAPIITAPAYVTGDLFYTGNEQSLLNAEALGTATVGTVTVDLEYAISTYDGAWSVPGDGDWGAENYKVTNAGKYKVLYRAVASDNYEPASDELTEKVVAPADLTAAWEVAGATPTANTWTYDTEAHALVSAPTAAIKFGTTAIPYEYCATNSVNDADWTTDLSGFTAASNTENKTVYWRVKETANYSGHAATALTATIEKATPVFTELPTFAESKPYDGQELYFITSAGTATLGAVPTFQRRTQKATGGWSSWSDWKTDITSADLHRANAGTYQIRYTTKTTDDLKPAIANPYATSDPITISKVTIAAESFTAPAAVANLTYDPMSAGQPLITAGSWGENPALGTFQYSLTNDGTDWSADVPQAIAAGNYEVYYKIVPTDATNCEEYVAANPIAVTIAKATIPAASFNAPVAATGLKADGNAHELVTAASWIAPNNYGTFQYSLDNTNWYDAVDADDVKGTAAGNYSVYFKIEPTDATNYEEYVAAAPIAVTIGGYTPVYIVPTAAQKYYGTEDPASFEYTVVNATTSETLDNSVLKGTVSLARTNGNAIGTYKIYVKGYTPAAEDGDYTVVNILNTPASEDAANKTAVFTILVDPNAELKLNFTADAIANKASKVYDGTTDITALGFTVDDLEADETTLIGDDTWASLKGSATVVFALAAENGNAQETKVTATVSGGLTARYATVTVTPMDFEITKLPITITANDQEIAQGADIDQNEYVTAPAPVAGDDLNIVLTATKSAVGEWDDAITVAATNANYDFNFVPGKLTINGAASITLSRNESLEQLIKDYDGQDVVVKFANMTMKAKEWYAIVLPFATSPAELVKALDEYAVFNVLDTENSTDQNFKFKLEMDNLPAGVPFLIKPAGNLDWADFDLGTISSNPVKKTIVSAITPVTAQYQSKDLVTFTGTYANDKILGVPGKPSAETANILGECWWLSDTDYAASKIANDWRKPKNNAHALKSMEAYLLAGEGWTTYSPSFTVEDFDGQTTSIKTLGAETIHNMLTEGWYTLNGVKLQSAPTQKGVYINNGKKVVIR